MLVLTWTDSTGQTVDVEFDVVTSETYEAVMAITAHPVEKGAPVVDHAREEPKKLSIEGFVSNTPLPSNLTDAERNKMASLPVALDYSGANKPQGAPLLSPGGLMQALSSAVDSLLGGGDKLPETVTAFRAVSDMPDRARDIFEKLEAARTNRSLITASTTLHSVENLLIEHVTVARTVESAGGLPFEIGLTQVRIVSSETVSYPKPSQPRASKEVKKGAQQAESFLWQGGNALGAWP